MQRLSRVSEGPVQDESTGPAPRVRLGPRARQLLGLGAGLAVAALAAYGLGVSPRELAAKLASVSPWMLVGCFLSGLVLFGLQSFRWHLIMGPLLGLKYDSALRAQIVGTMFNTVVPARGGDLLRVEYLARKCGKPRATILGTAVVDRWLDWWGWVPVAVMLVFVSDVPSWLRLAIVTFSVVLVVWAVIMVVIARRSTTSEPTSRLKKALRSFRAGIESFGSPRTLVIALIVAPLPWLWEAGVMLVAAQAFDIHLSFPIAFSALIGLNIATVVPSPGAMGAAETGGAATLALYGVEHTKALAFVFAYHVMQLSAALVSGLLIVLFERRPKLSPAG